MSVSHEIEFTVTKTSSELKGHEGKNLERASGSWLAHSTFGTAWVDVAFGSEFSIHSISLVATGCSNVKVVLQSRKGDRDNWMGGSGALRGGAVTTGGVLVYEGALPGEDCKKYLPCKNSGDGLKAVASQEEWAGMRISLTPAAGRSGGLTSSPHLVPCWPLLPGAPPSPPAARTLATSKAAACTLGGHPRSPLTHARRSPRCLQSRLA